MRVGGSLPGAPPGGGWGSCEVGRDAGSAPQLGTRCRAGAGTASEGPPDCRAWDALEPVEIQARVVERERAGSVLWLALGTEARAIAVPEDSGGGGVRHDVNDFNGL